MPFVCGIIVHQTGAATAESSLNSYLRPNANGAHLLIDREGTIHQTASLKQMTWHVGPLKARCLIERRDGSEYRAMVKPLGPLLVFALATWSTLAFGRCTAGSEFEPSLCPFRLPPVARVTIEENGAKSKLESDPSVSCASFRVDVASVLRYFRRARAVDPATSHSTLLWSPCYAAGTIELRDGRRARWFVSQFAVGSLRYEGDDAEQTLFCPSCRGRPFIR